MRNNQSTEVNLRSASGESSELKLSPPVVTSDPNLQRIVEKIYEDINKINNAVNLKKASSAEHKGKQGDIRIIPDASNPKIQHLQGFGSNGWTQFASSDNTTYKGIAPPEALHSKPDYDSGWVAIAKTDSLKTFVHNLGTKYFRIVALFKFTGNDSGDDYNGHLSNVSLSDIHYLNSGNQTFGSTSIDDVGFGISTRENNKIRFWTGDNGIFYIDNNGTTTPTVALQGSIRLFLHKIPLGN